ncbi:MAG TPA: hypothetical protein VFX97_17720 [Pyrinomonadaceae bacterium]|nr:hypothetical protein [Pyrinomonadaceae bacterium]
MLTEVSEANNHAFIELIVARYVVDAVDGETLLKPLIVSDTTIIAFFLQRFGLGFNGALRSRHKRSAHQREEQYDADRVRE